MYFIGIGDPVENVARVKIRALQGGHDLPGHVVIDRWRRSMDLLAEVARIADQTLIFDNGARDLDAAIRPMAAVDTRGGTLRLDVFPGAPTWVSTHLVAPLTTGHIRDG